MKRGGFLKRTAMPRRRKKSRTDAERQEQETWANAVDVRAARYGAIRSSTDSPRALWTERHHVVDQQVCRGLGIPVWDVRNGVAVTERRHDRHHSRHEPITQDEIRRFAPAALEFVEQYGLEAWYERHYPREGAPNG